MITIILNGKEEKIKTQMNITEFLKTKEIKKDSVVVMINEEIIKKERFEEVTIKENDEVEILRFVSGG